MPEHLAGVSNSTAFSIKENSHKGSKSAYLKCSMLHKARGAEITEPKANGFFR
jgi:hypothetical protein